MPVWSLFHYVSHKVMQCLRRLRNIKEYNSLELCLDVSSRHQNSLQRTATIVREAEVGVALVSPAEKQEQRPWLFHA